MLSLFVGFCGLSFLLAFFLLLVLAAWFVADLLVRLVTKKK